MAGAVSRMPDDSFREWAPLSDLFNRLPTKIQNGLFPQDVNMTCVDALSDFIVLGTNLGVVYWYDRKKKDLQGLRCENSNSPITAVRVISTVDYMVACGNKDGNISIFQIPKSHPDNLPESLRPKNKQVERYSVSEMHHIQITALEWSKNGMKLFSGDKNGLVVLTEIDFYMHLCKSMEILNESYEVVQLSYYQQILLISTIYRSIICQKTNKWKVTQVGKKDRKILGTFGGLFHQNGIGPMDVILYCTRPGLRIWESDIQGTVQKTLLFKDILNKESPEVPLLNPISNGLKDLKPCKEASFGILLPFRKDLLVTFSNDVVYVLNPRELVVLATISNLRSVLSVATCKNEIFILEGERSLIRISDCPESQESNKFFSHVHSIPNPLKELTSRLQATSIISAIPPFLDDILGDELNIHTDTTSIMNAEEAVESHLNNDDFKNKLEIYDKIGNEQFEDNILFKHSRRKKPNEMTVSISSWSSNSSDEKDSTSVTTKSTVMNLSTVGVLPDLRSPDTILNDIEHKEKILADMLNLGKRNTNTDTHKIKTDISKAMLINSEKEDTTTKAQIHTCSKSNHELDTTKSPTINGTNAVTENINQNCVLEHSKTESAKNSLNFNKQMELTKANKNDIMKSPNKEVKDVNKIETVKPPACLDIPSEWNLSKVTIKEESVANQQDASLSDWEII